MPDSTPRQRPPRAYRQVARADASRELRARIIDAAIGMMRKSRLEDVTLDRIAEIARTTRQTLLRLYGNRAGLIAAAVEQWPAQLQSQFAPSDLSTPKKLVDALCGIYEAVGDLTLNFLALLPNQPELAPLIIGGRERHRDAVDRLLRSMAISCDDTAMELLRHEALVVTDLHVWKLLRRERGKSDAETAAIMTHMLVSLIKAASASRDS